MLLLIDGRGLPCRLFEHRAGRCGAASEKTAIFHGNNYLAERDATRIARTVPLQRHGRSQAGFVLAVSGLLAPALQLASLTVREGEEHVAVRAKILVADRNRHVREFLRRELEAEGYEVQVARDGHEVCDLLNGSAPPDLVILDLEIPYLEELSALAHLREQDPPVPLIVLSYGEEPPPGVQVTETAVFLEKTEDPARLKAVVAEVLNTSFPRSLLSHNP